MEEIRARGCRPKIALFIAGMGVGGAERVFLNLARELCLKGFSVDLVAGTFHGAANLELLPAAVRLVDLKMNRMSLGSLRLIAYLRREKPAALLAAGDHTNCLAVLSGILAGTRDRVFINAVNMISPQLLMVSQPKRWLFEKFIRFCFPRARAVIAVSEGVAAELKNTFSVSPGNLKVIYTPIITKELSTLAAASVDHIWFKEGAPPVIITLGGLKPVKDQETLIRAFALVRQTADARLVIIGEGDRRNCLETLINNLGLNGYASLVGFKENPFAFIAKSKVFVLSSVSEGLPSVLIEALACGCRVVSTDCNSGPNEILRGGQLGRLVPVGNVAAMAEAICASLREEGVTTCRNEDLIPFTVESSAKAYLKVLLGEERPS